MNKLKSLARRFAAWKCRTFHVKHWERIEPGKRKCSKCERVYRAGWKSGGHISAFDKRLPR